MVVAGTFHRTYLLTPGELDEAAIACFSTGQCHAMALALHRLTDWQIVAITDEDDEVNHLAVRTPSGRILDIAGAHDPEALEEAWDGQIVPMSEADALALERTGVWRRPDIETASSLADAVLEYEEGGRPSHEPGRSEDADHSRAPREAWILGDDEEWVRIAPGGIDERVRGAYRGRGQSAAMASALYLALGHDQATLVLVRDEDDEPVHAAVRLADGRMLDIDGPCTAERFSDRWPGHHQDQRRPSALEEEVCEADYPWPAPDLVAAELLAPEILAEAGLPVPSSS